MSENPQRSGFSTHRSRIAAVFSLLAAASMVASLVPVRSVQSADVEQPGRPSAHDGWTPGDPVVPVSTNSAGASVYSQVCAPCHEHAAGHAPSAYILKIMTPESIYGALTSGAMRVQAKDLSDEEKRSVAEFLTGVAVSRSPKLAPPPCSGAAAKFDPNQPPAFPAWGLAPTNTRYVDSAAAGIDAARLNRLHLKWAVGFDGADRVRSQPALEGGAIYLGTQDGHVYALDRDSGCLRWQFQSSSEVRTGIVASPWSADHDARHLLYFGDIVGNVYAIDAISGALVWRDHADPHPSTTLTAAPAVYQDRLYVPVSSLEEGVAGEKYDCCTFRGSVVAYDAATGKKLWRRYLVPPPRLQNTLASGGKAYGPSGVAIWNTPSIDAKRSMLYVDTGDNYSSPATSLSDSIVAMDLVTGKIKWSYRTRAHDAWNGGCVAADKTSCPKENGPDYDMSAATILATTPKGRQLVLGGSKSGWVYAVEPDSGQLVWKTKVGRGGIVAGVYFGMATHEDSLFVPINDAPDGRHHDEPAKPGLYALELNTGAYRWKAPTNVSACEDRGPLCAPGIAAAVTAAGDVVLSGASDGRVRIYSADTGSVLWQYDTMQDTPTINGGSARGGSMGGGAGIIADHGMLIVESGYGFAGRMAGNLMLVFSVD